MATIRLRITNENNPSDVWDKEVLVVYGKVYSKERPNQVSVVTLDGVSTTYDRGVTIVKGDIVIKRLTPEDFRELDTFITEKLLFNLNPFSVEIFGADVDLGSGRGIDLSNCKMGDEFNSTDGLYNHKAPDLYHVNIPYRYVQGV